ncbi:sel1 repeat family protein [Aestuariivirga litoralis]|uniref:Sel1 repeat family protein n=1 Tax=Aestuariivirga litoralis TaxID=2650924 RepID=A0A2W2ATG7_9HYPH|nr:tetratricopeptide repeat protein [Aestuariivirga litoralis]PZF76972.1 sel1 repeat family protein [Aestuariivirga litoralis]
MRQPVLALAALLLAAAPAAAQSLEELPFDKQMTLAKVGDVDAQYQVGLAYETGKGVAVDEAEAARWFRQAALQGNVEAQYHLARLVSRGAKGLKQDYPTALKLYQDAAAKGFAPAMDALGQAYQQGRGAEVDLARAAEWYQKAADQKLADAQNNLGMLYLEGKGVARDLNKAFSLFEAAAAQNDPWGLNNLGGMYEMGWGTTADKTRALDLYQQALAAGNTRAQANIDRLQGKSAAAE